MASAAAAPRTAGLTPRRRVRHDARDTVAVMAFSALTSCGVALLLTLLVRIAN